MDGTNNEEEGDENEEKILISKCFHLVSLKQTYTQNLTKASVVNKISFSIAIFFYRDTLKLCTPIFYAFLQRKNIETYILKSKIFVT